MLHVNANGTAVRDSFISVVAQSGISVTGGVGGTRFVDDVSIRGQVDVDTSGAVSLRSATTSINALTSLRVQRDSVDIVTLNSGGLTLRDKATQIHGNATLALRAGSSLSLGHGDMGSTPAVVIDAGGTLVQDSLVSVTASNQVVVRASKGAVFKDVAIMEDGE